MEKYCLKFALVILVIVLSGAKNEANGVKMIHRHSSQSPFYRKFVSNHERIQELAWLDSLRIRSLDNTNSNKDIAPSEAPHKSFAIPVVSGATLGSALYFIELYIGTPPQKALLVADTGSDLIWVNCNSTSSNRTTFPTFNPDNSSSLSYVPCYSRDCYAISPRSACIFKPKIACKYSYAYLDSSTTSGPYVRDTITLKSSAGRSPVKAEKVFMGCGTENQGQSLVGSGGVLGLGQGFNSFSTQTSHLYGGKFSYCLVDYLEPPQVKSSLVFGDMGDSNSSGSFLQEPIQYTPILKGGSSFYYIGIEGITINGEKLPISKSVWEIDGAGNGGSIIDSGTSLTYFIDEAYEVILEALKVAITYPRASTLSPQGFDLCFNTSGISDLKFPEISIELGGGQRFNPPSENFMLEIEDDVRCVGFHSLGGQSIIGNLLQQNFFVEYDRDLSVLGFAAANCSVHS